MPDTVTCPHCGKKLRAPDGGPPAFWKCAACGRTVGASAEDALGPAEGTYGVARAKAVPKRPPARCCKVCGAGLRPDATLCDLCGTPLDEDDLPDTPPVRERRQRRALRQLEDEGYRRTDLIVAQVGCAFFGALLLGLGYLHVSVVVAVGITAVLGGWAVHYRKGPPASAGPALRKRWARESKGVAGQFLLSLALTVALVLFVVFAVARAAAE
jgi:hypothetical protein